MREKTIANVFMIAVVHQGKKKWMPVFFSVSWFVYPFFITILCIFFQIRIS